MQIVMTFHVRLDLIVSAALNADLFELMIEGRTPFRIRVVPIL